MFVRERKETMAEEKKKGGCLFKILVAILVILVAFTVIVFAMPAPEKPFEEEDIVGMEVSEAAAVFTDAGYEVSVFSETGAELSFDGMTGSGSMKWYVYSCDADHGYDTVEVVVVSEESPLLSEIM